MCSSDLPFVCVPVPTWFGLTTLLLLLQSTPPTQSANILFYSPIASYSHKIAMWPLAESLAISGHNVTFLSVFDKKPSTSMANANVTDYNPKELSKWFHAMDEEYQPILFNVRDSLHAKLMDWVMLFTFGIEACECQLQEQEFID